MKSAFFTDDGEPILWKDLIEYCHRKRPHERFLYRLFDAQDDLIYVGVTWNLGYRFLQHKQKKPWWNEVERIAFEIYPTANSCLAAERAAISTENPKYNLHRKRTT